MAHLSPETVQAAFERMFPKNIRAGFTSEMQEDYEILKTALFSSAQTTVPNKVREALLGATLSSGPGTISIDCQSSDDLETIYDWIEASAGSVSSADGAPSDEQFNRDLADDAHFASTNNPNSSTIAALEKAESGGGEVVSQTNSHIEHTPDGVSFEEIEERARELFSHANRDVEWYFLDEGDRDYWRKMAVDELKRRQDGEK